MKTDTINRFIRDIYNTDAFIPLHEPRFLGNEKKYVGDTIDSTFVSSVGQYVIDFEKQIEAFTGTTKAVATVNGTAALHLALVMAGVQRDDLVITQALTFVATCNALHHMGAEAVFVDVSPISLGLCPEKLTMFLDEHAFIDEDGVCRLKETKQRFAAIVPMHTFGHPVQMDELNAVAAKWGITVVEDAAESLGSYYKGQHTGTISELAALSFNGNKVITTGGGGMVLCRDIEVGNRCKHLSTTAKKAHPYEFFHDEAGFNYRLPNLNAALGCAQMEQLDEFLHKKRQLAEKYEDFFSNSEFKFVKEPKYAKSNYWLNAVMCPDKESRDNLLVETNAADVMTRPVWQLMHRLPMFEKCLRGDLTESERVEALLVNLPSSVPLEW